jgi:hypothetical protein
MSFAANRDKVALAQLAERNRLRAELASLGADKNRRFKAAREEGFDLLLSGANKDRITAKRQQQAEAAAARAGGRARQARRPDPTVPRRGWQQETVRMLAADGQQLRVRPHAEGESALLGGAEMGPACNGDAEHEHPQAAPPLHNRATSQAVAAASAEVEDTGEYGDDFEDELDDPGQAAAARQGHGRAAELQHEIAELRISLHELKSARAMGEAAGAEDEVEDEVSDEVSDEVEEEVEEVVVEEEMEEVGVVYELLDHLKALSYVPL